MEGQFGRKGKHPTTVGEFYTGKEFSEWCPTNEFTMYNGRKVITVPFGMWSIGQTKCAWSTTSSNLCTEL